MGVPHINVLTKCDKIPDKDGLEEILQMSTSEFLLQGMNKEMPPKYLELNKKIVEVIDNFNMVQYIPLNIQDEESEDSLIHHMDTLVQYDEFRLPQEHLLPREDGENDYGNEGGEEGNQNMDY